MEKNDEKALVNLFKNLQDALGASSGKNDAFPWCDTIMKSV